MSKIIKTLNVEGMSCSHCERAVKNALNELSGVSNTEVSLEEKTVTVEYDSDVIEEERLIEEIEDVGYDVVR
jgi:copper chaperone